MPEKRNPQNLSPDQLRRLQTLQEENASLKQEMDNIGQRARELEQSRQAQEEELNKSRQELTASAKELTKARKELESVRKELSLAQKELEKAGQRTRELEQGRQAQEEELNKSRQELTASGKELDKAHKELESVRKELEKTGKRHQTEQLQFLAQKTELEELLASSRKEAEELRAKLSRENSQWSREKEKLARSLETLKREKDDLAEMYQKNLQDMENLKAALDGLVKAIPELADKPPGSREFVSAVQDYAAQRQVQEQRIAQLEAKLKDDQTKLAEAEGLDSRIGDLIALNRSLQEELDSLQHSQGLLEGRIKEIQAEAAKDARQELEATKKEMQNLQDSLSALNKENSSLIYQLQQENKIPVLSPERVSIMLNEFQESLKAGMKDVEIREGEVKLKIGIAAADEHSAGFIIPSADNISEVRDGLSEISFSFGKVTSRPFPFPDTK
ncbi:hypothetical protein [Desulfonatronospira sp.]|uniref:hypothetical protein n=1 Tax=Desulfonatronospira sp. TaxID=1962951 RepID=UPI0025BA529C|nr:hypothetical protein [Desulfonatronospira sp.]